MSLCFFGRGYISKGDCGSPTYLGGLLIKGKSNRFRFFFFFEGLAGLVKKGWGQCFRVDWYPGGHYVFMALSIYLKKEFL